MNPHRKKEITQQKYDQAMLEKKRAENRARYPEVAECLDALAAVGIKGKVVRMGKISPANARHIENEEYDKVNWHDLGGRFQ